MSYDLEALYADLQVLEDSGARVFDIGTTESGRAIPCVFKGNESGDQVLVVATTHAREYITTPLVIEMMKNYSGSVGIWCVPMLNIDGALLCQYGLSSVEDASRRQFLNEINGGSTDYSLWKANIRAVDLNVNFNADWGTGEQNVGYPAPANYVGEYPVSESENIALRELCLRIQPKVMLSYHTRGQVIYHGFKCNRQHYQQALRFGDITGYTVLESEGSAGGFKDWFMATTPYLGLTIETVAADIAYPIPLEILPTVYQNNSGVLALAAQVATEI